MLLLALAASTTAGCNTMRGVGKDVEATGQHIQKATE
jgi:predicted small secreted protein